MLLAGDGHLAGYSKSRIVVGESQDMDSSNPKDSVERAIRQLDESLAQLRRMTQEVDEAGNPNPPSLQTWATKELLRLFDLLQEAVPGAMSLMIETAYKDLSTGDATAAEARKGARHWPVSSGFLSEEELAELPKSRALKLVQERMKQRE